MSVSRRSFLALGPALTTARWVPGGPERSDAPLSLHSGFDPWVEVHADHLRHNVAQIATRVKGRPILAVIKNNGYGLGVTNVARILDPLPAVWGFAVVKLNEAVTLRDGGVRKPILLMGPLDEPELPEALARQIEPMVYTDLGAALDRRAEVSQKAVPIHVCVDTGIGRVGVPYREAATFIKGLARRSAVKIRSTMMTFTEDPEFDQEQLRRFNALCDQLQAEGLDLGFRHAASSFGLFQRPDAFLDMVRPGMAIFGVYSEHAFRTMGILDLRPAVSLKARVLYVKQLKKGDGAGYNRAYVADRDVWVATLPVGHTDGWPRAAAKGARVRIGDRLYPVIASVSASHTIVEVGEMPRVQRGDTAVYFDWRDGSRPEDVSAACQTSVYDLTMHLNPLLPRHVV